MRLHHELLATIVDSSRNINRKDVDVLVMFHKSFLVFAVRNNNNICNCLLLEKFRENRISTTRSVLIVNLTPTFYLRLHETCECYSAKPIFPPVQNVQPLSDCHGKLKIMIMSRLPLRLVSSVMSPPTFDLVTVPELVDDADVEDDHEYEWDDEEDEGLEDAVGQPGVITPDGDTVGKIPHNIIARK